MAGNNNKHAIWAVLLTFTSVNNYINFEQQLAVLYTKRNCQPLLQ